MTKSLPSVARLLDAAVVSSREGDEAGAVASMLAAAETLEAYNRPTDAREVRALCRRLFPAVRP